MDPVTHVEFRSDRFPPDADEDAVVNPGRHGRKLAAFVAAGLRARGVDVGESVAEDWGWMVPVLDPVGGHWIGCGNRDGEERGYLCFVEPAVLPWWRLRGRERARERVRSEVAALGDALRAVLTAEGIDGLRAMTADEFRRGG